MGRAHGGHKSWSQGHVFRQGWKSDTESPALSGHHDFSGPFSQQGFMGKRSPSGVDRATTFELWCQDRIIISILQERPISLYV